MRKIRKIRFFGILGILTAVLFLASISFMQAQVQAKGKPDKPPGKPDKPGEEEAIWEVEIPEIPGKENMLYGDGSLYVNDGNKVIVKAETMKSKVKGKIYYTYFFCFKLVNPISRYAGFKDVDLYNEHTYSEPCCFFPGGCGADYQTCMDCFLNRPHPVAESDYFYLKFWISEHSLPGRTLEDMPIDTSCPLAVGNNGIKFRIQNTEDFVGIENEYHNIDCEEHTWGEYALNASITKTAENTWRISFDNEGLLVQEMYTVRKHPVRPITENVVPLEATGYFTFWIDFIKVE
jgi:hypothetical protein